MHKHAAYALHMHALSFDQAFPVSPGELYIHQEPVKSASCVYIVIRQFN